MTSTTWILVANASQAMLYKTMNLGSSLQAVKNYNHPKSRVKNLDLRADRLGRYQSRDGEAHGAFVEKTEPKTVEAERFAIKLAHELENGRTTHQYERLIIIAPPHFQGLLNQHCNDHIKQLVISQIEKDYTQMNERELNRFLAELPRF